MANSLMFVLPTICTPRARAISRQAASFSAGLLFLDKYSEPPVVTTPLTSMLSFRASLSCLLSLGGGQ